MVRNGSVQSLAPKPIGLGFDNEVDSAIQEERKLRTEGACFWDSFRRISWYKALARVLGGFFFQCKANKWQAAQDRDTIRPRVLRWSSCGTAVYAGTVQRNQLMNGLKGAISATEKSLKSSPAIDLGPEAAVEGEGKEPLDNLRVKGQPLKPYIEEIINRSRGLLGEFTTSQFGDAHMITAPNGIQKKIKVDPERQEVFIQITEFGLVEWGMKSSLNTPTSTKEDVHARMVIRVSYRDGLDVRVISAEARKGFVSSFVGDTPTPHIAKMYSWEGVDFSPAAKKETARNAAADLAKRYPFYTALGQAWGKAEGQSQLSCDSMMWVIQSAWAVSPDDETFKDQEQRRAALRKLKTTFHDWNLRENPGKADAKSVAHGPEGDFSTLQQIDLPVISVATGRPVVVISDEFADAPLRAVRYNVNGETVMPTREEDLLGPVFDPAREKNVTPLILRRDGAAWHGVSAEEASEILASDRATPPGE